MKTSIVFFLLLGVVCGMASAQFDAAILCHSGPVILFDTATSKATSIIPQALAQASRGGMFGPRGYIYTSNWTDNGIGVLDPVQGTWIAGLLTKDPSNFVMGAPYQPCPNYDNLGGFGILCVDGNPAPTSLNPPANSRNTFVVDYSTPTPTFRVDGFFLNTDLPMTDMVPNPHGAGFIGVGFGATDHKVDHYPLASPPLSTLTLTNLCNFPMDAMYDATVGEDGNYYVVAQNLMMICDTRAKTVTTVTMTGLPAGYCGIWAEPWEKPGMKAFIVSDVDDSVYSVDLLAAPMAVTSVVKLPNAGSYNINTARSAEECQLCSWKSDKKGKRNFHVNFGPNALGQVCVLVPSLLGLNRNPLILSGLEIYLAIDDASRLGLQGFLPYPSSVFLGTSGEADILWNGFGTELGIQSYWQAVTFNKQGKFTDVSNIINVSL